MAKSSKFKINPAAIVAALLFFIPGALLGQMVGLQLGALTYTILYSFIGGSTASIIGFLPNLFSKVSNRNFFTAIAVSLAIMLGGILSSMTLGPILFFYVTTSLGANVSLAIGLMLGAFVVGGIGYLATKLHKNAPQHVLNILAFSLIGMVICGCLGIALNPLAWMVCLLGGAGLGILFGIGNSLFNKTSDTSKVLSSLYAITGTMVGVMLGAIVSTLIPVLAPALVSAFFGFSLMFSGVLLGHVVSKQYPEFDLNNAKLREKVYLAVLSIPLVFFGYLSGGIIGYSFLPSNTIILSQALGMVSSFSLYGLCTGAYFVIRDFIVDNFIPKKPDTLGEVSELSSSNFNEQQVMLDAVNRLSQSEKHAFTHAIDDNPEALRGLILNSNPGFFGNSVKQPELVPVVNPRRSK